MQQVMQQTIKTEEFLQLNRALQEAGEKGGNSVLKTIFPLAEKMKKYGIIK